MGRNLGSAFRQELANLDKDPDTYKTAMSNLRTIVKDLDSKVIHAFLTQVSETKEIGSDSGGGYTVSLFEDLARAHGVKISPHVETIMPVIVRTLSSCGGSLSVQQACSKAVAAIARYGIDPATAEDKKRNVIHSLCKPLSDSLIDSHHQQHLALGAALCLKSLVDCDSWRYAFNEMVNSVCQSLAVALEATSSEAESHLALVIALAKRNAFIVEAYARLLVKSGLRILELGAVEGDAQKRVLAVQMLNFLMKYLNPKSISSEVELVLQELGKHVDDEMYFVRRAVHETLSTAERLIKEADPSVKSTPSLRNGVSGSPLVTYGVEDDGNMEFNESVCSRTSRPRSSRRNRKKKRRSERSRHGFTQDSFTVLLENREQLRQYSESSSSSSPIHERSGTTTPTEDICEKPKSEARVGTEEIVTELTRRDRSKKKSVMRWGLSFFSVVVVGFASFMWVHLRDDIMMMPPHLVPT
ncbi:ARM repeat superfamily protein [Raphanus sativus]|uniref:Protein SINE2-like n=1 Tax=Raphanus sativus TaxID=3726 RepID=A0A9W3CKD1_RAPSA|nr:protein SINE2-like [Raphanus sativus]KAJ4873691.1 ARM repeat superfamily protein [Raphanus sativus]